MSYESGKDYSSEGEQERLLQQLDDGEWDSDNHQDFMTVLYIAITLCLIPITLIGNWFGMNVGTVERWLSGEARPARTARWAIFNAIRNYLRAQIKNR